MTVQRRRKVVTEEADLDALQQRIADLEGLLASPGWILLCTEARKLYGHSVFIEHVTQITRIARAQDIGEQTIALVAARQTAVELLGMPDVLLKTAQRSLSHAMDAQRSTPALGPNVELSQ